jgi:hypothetical protein
MRNGHLLLGFVLAAGCAGMLTPLEQRPDFGQYFTLRMSDDTEQAKLDGARLYGPDLELTRMGDGGYRGRGPSGTIDLRTEGRKIAGTVGAGSTELYLDDAGGTLLVKGRYADRLSELELRADRVRGTIGRCQYDLQRPDPRAAWYQGQRACGGNVAGVELALPTALGAMPPIDRGLLLAVFLASEQAPRRESAPQPRSTIGDPRDAGRRPGVDPNSGRRMP